MTPAAAKLARNLLSQLLVGKKIASFNVRSSYYKEVGTLVSFEAFLNSGHRIELFNLSDVATFFEKKC